MFVCEPVNQWVREKKEKKKSKNKGKKRRKISEKTTREGKNYYREDMFCVYQKKKKVEVIEFFSICSIRITCVIDFIFSSCIVNFKTQNLEEEKILFSNKKKKKLDVYVHKYWKAKRETLTRKRLPARKRFEGPSLLLVKTRAHPQTRMAHT